MPAKLLVAVILTWGVGLFGVGRAMGQGAGQCSIGAPAEGSFGVNSKVGAPFTATARISFEQKLPDGNAIRAYSRVHEARSSLGRTRHESPQRCFMDEDGTLKLAYSIRTYDPELKIFKDWNVYGDVLGWKDRMIYTSDLVPLQPRADPSEDLVKQRRSSAAAQWSASEYKIEKLGTKILFGVSVVGERRTRTIPEGKEGNELELEIVDEHWWSQTLGQDLLAIHDDPRIGKTTYEIEQLDLAEPDGSLFIAPAGYETKPTQPV